VFPPLSDVTVRYLPFPEAIAAMGTKTVDASFMIEPLPNARSMIDH